MIKSTNIYSKAYAVYMPLEGECVNRCDIWKYAYGKSGLRMVLIIHFRGHPCVNRTNKDGLNQIKELLSQLGC